TESGFSLRATCTCPVYLYASAIVQRAREVYAAGLYRCGYCNRAAGGFGGAVFNRVRRRARTGERDGYSADQRYSARYRALAGASARDCLCAGDRSWTESGGRQFYVQRRGIAQQRQFLV